LAELGIKPVPIGKQGATCKNSSADILLWLAPFPKCWQCYLELREQVHLGVKFADHQVVICAAYAQGAKKKEIMFDWWGDTMKNRAQSEGPPDPFRSEWPDNPFIVPERYYGCTRNCAGNPVRPDLAGYPQSGRPSFPSCMEPTNHK
jgi:hypothetical protein